MKYWQCQCQAVSDLLCALKEEAADLLERYIASRDVHTPVANMHRIFYFQGSRDCNVLAISYKGVEERQVDYRGVHWGPTYSQRLAEKLILECNIQIVLNQNVVNSCTARHCRKAVDSAQSRLLAIRARREETLAYLGQFSDVSLVEAVDMAAK